MFESSLPTDKPKVVKNPFYVRWRNVLLGLLIGVALIGIGLVAYYYLNLKSLSAPPEPSNTATSSAKTANPATQTDETAGWKTYTNNTYGFTLKYPSDWKNVRTTNLVPGDIVQISKDEDLGEATYEIDIYVDEDPSTITYFNKISSYKVGEATKITREAKLVSDTVTVTDTITRFTDTTVGGFQAIRYRYENGSALTSESAESYVILINKSGKYYTLSGAMTEPDYFDTCKQMMDKILLTFRFD